MKLVVCLGNPGRKYEGTRHNVGYEVAAELAREFGVSKPKQNFQGEVVEANIGGARALLLCPQTYMNLSGQSVVLARDFYRIENDDVLVVCDDFNLPLGKLRLRAEGSAGGHNGLANIADRLGTQKFARLRIGVGEAPPGRDWADFVLSRFTAQEQPEIKQAIERAAQAVVVWSSQGIQTAMNQFN